MTWEELEQEEENLRNEQNKFSSRTDILYGVVLFVFLPIAVIGALVGMILMVMALWKLASVMLLTALISAACVWFITECVIVSMEKAAHARAAKFYREKHDLLAEYRKKEDERFNKELLEKIWKE